MPPTARTCEVTNTDNCAKPIWKAREDTVTAHLVVAWNRIASADTKLHLVCTVSQMVQVAIFVVQNWSFLAITSGSSGVQREPCDVISAGHGLCRFSKLTEVMCQQLVIHILWRYISSVQPVSAPWVRLLSLECTRSVSAPWVRLLYLESTRSVSAPWVRLFSLECPGYVSAQWVR